MSILSSTKYAVDEYRRLDVVAVAVVVPVRVVGGGGKEPFVNAAVGPITVQ